VELVVGRIGRAHGVQGEVAVEVRTDDPDHRFAVGAVLDTDPPERGPLTIARCRPHSGRLLISFTEVVDRDAAESLRGTLLVADSASSAATDDPDEYWDHDLVGLAAVTTSGERLGDITAVLHLPGQDVLSVKRDGAEPELLVPFVAAIVPEVDVRGGRVVVDPPPGLLDPDQV
jgi:16S rRNA processing protein RimM